jgi:hypothetical protein
VKIRLPAARAISFAAAIALTALAAPAAAPAPAHACAIAPPPDIRVRMDAEEALIVWDAERRIEHFVRRAAFESAGDDFGFLVPTPSRPELAEADDQVFDRLASATRPEVIEETSWIPTTCCLFTFTAMLMTRGGEPLAQLGVPDVTVLHEQRVAGLDAAILSASDAGALASWLGEHGYATRPALTAWLQPYVEKGWIITAFKIAKVDGERPRLATRAVRMSFATDRPFYPYREPDDAATGDERALRVFFAGPARFAGALEDGTAWPAEALYSRPLASPSTILAGAVPAEIASSRLWLTDFLDEHTRRPPGGDLFFAASDDREEIVPPPIVHTRESALPLPIEPLLLGIGVWLLMRHRRKRRLAAGK